MNKTYRTFWQRSSSEKRGVKMKKINNKTQNKSPGIYSLLLSL